MDFKIIKTLGNGVMGTVFLCEYNQKTAIAKMEKFDGTFDTSNPYMRQIEFNEFAKLHADRFLTLLFSGIVNNCIFKQPMPKNIKEWPANFRNWWLTRQKSDVCSLLIYSPICSITLQDILRAHNLKAELRIEIFKHLKKSIEIMNNAGYYHRDLHAGNIMYLGKISKTNPKINPANFYIIDYGCIYHKTFKVSSEDKNRNKITQDIYYLIWCVCDNPVVDYMEARNINLPKYKKSLKFLQNHEIYPKLKQYLPSYVKKNIKIVDEIDYLHIVCFFLDYNVYCESIEVKYIQEKLKLIDYQPMNKAYFLNIIKNLKAPNL